MFDFLRNITKPAEEKRQERLNAYLDGALSTQEQRRFETELEQDAELRADLEQLRWVQLSVEQLPRVRAPRNFILDPAVYGQPAQQKATWSLYPGLRVATALTAFFFILALALDVATPGGTLDQPLLGGGAAQTAMEEPQRQADDVAMVAESEVASEEAEEPAAEDGALIAPFAATVEGEVGAAAEEAADEMVEEEALLAEEAAEEPAADVASADQPDTEETIGPASGGALESTERAIDATMTADEAAGITALAPPETPAPESTREATNAVEEPFVTDDAEGDADAFDEAQVAPQPEVPFPYLLVIEIVLGVALLALLIATLVLRRIA